MVYLYNNLNKITNDDYKNICYFVEKLPKTSKKFRRYNEQLRHNLCLYLLYLYLKKNKLEYLFQTFNYDQIGKPIISNFNISFSRCENCVAVGIDKKLIGVDVEDYISDFNLENNDFFTLKEKNKIENSKDYNFFLNCKEAYFKCIGSGITNQVNYLDYSIFYKKLNFQKDIFKYNCAFFNKYSYGICSEINQTIKIISYKELRSDLYESKKEEC